MAQRKSSGARGGGSMWLVCCLVASICSLASAQTASGCSAACTANGGRCLQTPNSSSYYCDCTGTGRSGEDCGSASNSSTPSSSNGSGTSTCPVACVNGACLQDTNSDAYYCQCKPGFSGTSCSSASAPSASPPATASASSGSSGTTSCPVECANGQCLQQENSNQYYCQCNAGFSGPACRNGTAAATPATASGTSSCPVACRNGQCLQQENSDQYYCQCSAGFSGQDCSSGSAAARGPATAATASTGCGSGSKCKRGTCKPVLNSNEYYCECPSGYTGWDCGISTSSASVSSSSGGSQQQGGKTLDGWKIFVIVLGAVVGIILAASVAYLVWKRRRSPATFVKSTDGDLEGQQEIEIKRVSSAT